MVSTAMNQPLNDTQILLLQTFARIKSEQEKEEVQDLLLSYYQKRVDVQASQVHFSDEKIEEILNSHYRTPYLTK
jgi:hypothetical protein